MEAIAHSPGFAKKAGVPQSVGKDFAKADEGKTFKGTSKMEKLPEHEKSKAHDSATPMAEGKGGHSETEKSIPVAGHTTGGGSSYGMAEHHQRAGEDKAHTFEAHQPSSHHMATEHHKGHHGPREAHAFAGTKKSGHHRVSGHSGAHMIGKRK